MKFDHDCSGAGRTTRADRSSADHVQSLMQAAEIESKQSRELLVGVGLGQ